MHTKLILCGPGASGKDTFKERLIERGSVREVSYTTRPKREGEVEGVSYHYISDEEFMGMVDRDELVQWNEFNGWKYGTSKEEFEKSDVLIMTPEGLSQLSAPIRERSFVILLYPPIEIREHRLQERKDADTVERRLEADKEQFDGFHDYDMIVTHPEFINHYM